MQANSIRQFSVKNNSYNNICNIHARQGIPVFKGAKEIKAAEGIIKEHATISASLSNALIEFMTSEQLIVQNITQMIAQISDLYKIKLDEQAAIKFVTDMIGSNKEKESNLAMRVVSNMVGLGNFAESLLAIKFTTKTGENFVQHCEKLPK